MVTRHSSGSEHVSSSSPTNMITRLLMAAAATEVDVRIDLKTIRLEASAGRHVLFVSMFPDAHLLGAGLAFENI